MLGRILTGIAVLFIVAVLIITVLPLTNEWVSAAEGDLAETNEATNDSGNAVGRELGRGKRHRMRKVEDLDVDGYPDLPEGFTRPCDRDGDGVPDLPDGVTPRWNRDRVRDPEADGEDFGRAFGMGKRHRMRKAEDLDGDGYPDLPEGITPRWNRGRVSDLEDTAGCPFRGRGRQGTGAVETP